MIEKIMMNTFFLTRCLLSASSLVAQNKKEQIELLQFKVDSLLQVLTNERKVSTQQVKDLLGTRIKMNCESFVYPIRMCVLKQLFE
jgi:hypothetical protein